MSSGRGLLSKSGVYAPLHPAPAFLCPQRNAGQRNGRLEFRSLISTNFNPRNVNSLRSNSTFLVIVSISTDCSLHKSRRKHLSPVTSSDCNRNFKICLLKKLSWTTVEMRKMYWKNKYLYNLFFTNKNFK